MEFFDQIRKYVTVFILFGTWSSTHGFKSKILLHTYSVVYVVALIVLFSVSIHSQQFYTYTTISNTMANSLYWLIMVTHLVVVFESISKNNAQKQLIEKFIFVDNLFQVNSNIRLPYEKEKRKIFIMSSTLVSSICLYYAAIYTYLYHTDNIRGFTIQSSLSIWIIRLRSMQVTFFVWILRTRLILLNQHLDEMSCVIKTQLNQPMFSELLHLKQIYRKLHGACESINDTFGFSILTIMTHSFIDFTLNCYWAYLSQQDYGKLIMFTVIQVQHSAVLSITGLACSLCYQEVIVEPQ